MSIRIKIFLFFALLSYFPALAQVDTAWVRVYYGLLGIDEAVDLAVDRDGNVYVTGYSDQWSTYYDYVTIKYSPNGDVLWIGPYNGSDVADFPTDWVSDLALDDSGNVYVTGASSGDGTSYDYATIKYAPNGDTLWVRRYNGLSNGDDGASALAVDKNGNLYVTGWSQRDTTYDYTTIKYSPNGDTLWIRRYQGAALSLAVDKNGNVFVTGHTWGVNSPDYATIKYAPNGDTLWVRRYSGPDNSDDRASVLIVDLSGNAYVSGSTVTIKYLPNGDTSWVRSDVGALALDKVGNLYIAGSYNNDYKTVKYDTNGNLIWARYYNGPANDEDWATDLAVDSAGSVYVTGSSSCDYLTVKYSTNGDTLWVRRDSGIGWDGCERPNAIALDNAGNVYVTGVYAYVVDGRDYLTIKYVQCLAKPGDADGDSTIQISDIVSLINHLFKDQPALNPLCRGDANADGNVLLSDIVYLINYLFKSGPAPIKGQECCL